MDWFTPQFLQGAITGFVIVGALVYFAPRKKPEPSSSQKVTPSCGCILCDLKVPREKSHLGHYHLTQHGIAGCTKPLR